MAGEAVRSRAPTPPVPDLAGGAPDLDTSCIVDEKADPGDAAWRQARVDAPPPSEVGSHGPVAQRQDPRGSGHGDPRATAALQAFSSLYSRWLRRGGEEEARQAFLAALASGVEFEEIARGAAAYLADRLRDRRGPAAAVQYCKPMARWLLETGWETWGGLPDAERQAVQAAADEHEEFLARARERDARRRSMPF